MAVNESVSIVVDDEGSCLYTKVGDMVSRVFDDDIGIVLACDFENFVATVMWANGSKSEEFFLRFEVIF
jgi:hypothetical protein